MRTIRHNRTDLDTTNAVLQTARGASVIAATAILRLIGRGCWSSADPMAGEAHQLARRIIELDGTLGVVCERDLSEQAIATMAESAHALIRGARTAADEGKAMLRCGEGDLILDPTVEAVLIPAYGIAIL